MLIIANAMFHNSRNFFELQDLITNHRAFDGALSDFTSPQSTEIVIAS